MNKIEMLKEQLYKAIDAGNQEEILAISKELDKLITDEMSSKEHHRFTA